MPHIVSKFQIYTRKIEIQIFKIFLSPWFNCRCFIKNFTTPASYRIITKKGIGFSPQNSDLSVISNGLLRYFLTLVTKSNPLVTITLLPVI
jgi:hypothetical protein